MREITCVKTSSISLTDGWFLNFTEFSTSLTLTILFICHTGLFNLVHKYLSNVTFLLIPTANALSFHYLLDKMNS